jgi:hypothetical protein
MASSSSSTRRNPNNGVQQRNSNLAEKRNRQDLFSNRQKKSSTTASEAQKIQKSLMKTQHLLKNELHRVSNISNAIEEDEQVLRQTMETQKSLNTKQAQKALTALQRAQQQEQRVLYASVVFFCAVVFHIMWSRVLIKFDFISVILDWVL